MDFARSASNFPATPMRLRLRPGVRFAVLRRIWPAPELVLALLVGGTVVPAAADTPTPRPLPSIEISLPGITLSVSPPAPPPPSVDALEATLLTRLNAERAAGGLAALALQPWASSVA